MSRARSEIAMDFHTTSTSDSVPQIDMPDYTFTLPDLSIYCDEFRTFLEKDLIECSTLNSLESASRLNWWAEAGFCRKLWPLATTGDGNCLLHAASLAMWGFHDRKLTLRAALHAILASSEYKSALWQRWRFQQTRLNKQAGLVYSELEWAKEWDEIVGLAAPEPRQSKCGTRRRSLAIADQPIDDTATYESLEEIHIMALAHVLRRTIIVVADTVLRDLNGEAMAPIPFLGVYLPFEIPAVDCHRAPLLLTYDMAHFSALVSMESANEQPPALVPLIDIDNVLLPIHFCIDPGATFEWRSYDGTEGNWALTDREHIALLKEYLDIVYATPLGSPNEDFSVDLLDDEYEKRIAEAELSFGDDVGVNGKSKAAKQLQSVAKQFGSIGKNMSKKIRKNIGSITKIGSGGAVGKNGTKGKNGLTSAASMQSFTRQRILCAQLRAKRHDYQDEMIKNYLECAHDRFMDTEKAKELREIEQQELDRLKHKAEAAAATAAAAVTPTVSSHADANGSDRQTHCINSGCKMYGTAATSYMCSACFEKQKERELNSTGFMDGPRYGTGNSKFYTQADAHSHRKIERLPSFRRLNDQDQTLYLSNSTFYNDTRPAMETPGKGGSTAVGEPQQQQQQQQTGKTIIIPIRMESDRTSVGDTEHIESTTITAAKPPIPYNILGIGKGPVDAVPNTSAGGPFTSTVSINCCGTSGATVVPINGDTDVYGTPTPASYADSLRNNSNGQLISAYIDSIKDPLLKSSRIETPFAQANGQHCRTADCKFFGSANTNFYCSKCCHNQQVKTQSKILTDV